MLCSRVSLSCELLTGTTLGQQRPKHRSRTSHSPRHWGQHLHLHRPHPPDRTALHTPTPTVAASCRPLRLDPFPQGPARRHSKLDLGYQISAASWLTLCLRSLPKEVLLIWQKARKR